MKKLKRKNNDDMRWKETADIFENDSSLKQLALSTKVSPSEHRQILGAGVKQAISIRIPESDLKELKKMAKANNRGYQQLIIQAIELYIDEYYKKIS